MPSAKQSELPVHHAPAGTLSISLSFVAHEDRGAVAGKNIVIPEKAVVMTERPAPAAHGSDAGKEGNTLPAVRPEIVPVRRTNGTVIGELELGRTSSDEARLLFENGGAGLGPEMKNTAPFVIGTTTLAPTRLYTPPGTRHQLYFDDNGILVLFVDGAAAVFPASGREFLHRFPEAKETGRIVGSYELQAELSPCVTVIALFRTVNDSLDSVAFGYVCPTKPRETNHAGPAVPGV